MKLRKEVVQFLRDSHYVGEAAFCASGYYCGQGDPLYILMCGIFEEWDEGDLESVAVAVERMATDVRDNDDEEWYDSSYCFEGDFNTSLRVQRGEV